jgi:hypothetical protein
MLALLRRTLAIAACCCFVGAYALTPSGVRSHAAIDLASLPKRQTTPVEPLVIVTPSDDPFRARVIDLPSPAPRTRAPVPIPLDLPRIGPLPPNAGASGAARLPVLRAAALAYTSAVALGNRPAAVIVTERGAQLVELGDAFEATRIRAIDERGVSLADGRRLALPPPASPR